MEKTTLKYPSVIVKISESAPLGYSKQLSTIVIRTFKDGQWSNLGPKHEVLLENAEIETEDNKIIIKGTKKIFRHSLWRIDYGKKYELFDEYYENGKKRTIEDVQKSLEHHTMGKLKVKDSDIKLFYDGFWNFVKRKRTYYLDCTPEVISHLSHVAQHEIQKDKKGYYVDGWYDTMLTEPYQIETNNYRIENH